MDRIEARTAVIAIVGLGYVGLPLAMTALRAGFRVVGLDNDPDKLKRIGGDSQLDHLDLTPVRAGLENGTFRADADARILDDADIVIICVPTPLSRNREPDLGHVVSAAETIAGQGVAGKLVVLESTSYPGTTTGVVRPILERGGLKSGTDFHLAFSPEREDPGNARFNTQTIPKVVGGDGEVALDLSLKLYGALVDKVVPVSSPDTAEAVKLTENIFRSVNIALVNELKVIFDAMGIDIWEVIEAAKTKPFGYMPFYPGPGLGGHCISIDPFYLTWKAREFDLTTRFIELAGQVNTAMPYYVLERLADALSRHRGKAINGARLLVAGVAYKKNVADTRESPALKLIEMLEERGAIADYHDPLVAHVPAGHGVSKPRHSVALSEEALRNYDAVLITTDHDAVDYKLVVGASPLVVDTRNACGSRGIIAANIVKA